MAQETLQKNTKLKKEFSYAKGDVSLTFTLSMENSSELRKFLDCLIAAQEDVKNIISEMKN